MGAFAGAAQRLGCAFGLQLTVFVSLGHSEAWLPVAKSAVSAWPWGNAARVRFFVARSLTACGGRFRGAARASRVACGSSRGKVKLPRARSHLAKPLGYK
jgi:hypothetical protein